MIYISFTRSTSVDRRGGHGALTCVTPTEQPYLFAYSLTLAFSSAFLRGSTFNNSYLLCRSGACAVVNSVRLPVLEKVVSNFSADINGCRSAVSTYRRDFFLRLTANYIFSNVVCSSFTYVFLFSHLPL